MSDNLYFDAGIDATKLYLELNKINARIGNMTAVAEKSGNQMDKTFKRVATAVGGYFSLQMFGRAASGIYNFQKEYESALTEVGTISDEIFGKFPQYQQQVLDLSTKGSQGPKKLANSLYQIVSAGYDGAEGLSVLEVAAKAATAGFSETKTTADGITTVLNAWGKPFTEASNVADTFFKTVERGKTTIPELTANIAQIAPIASSLKIPFEEVMGLMAAITKQGTPTAQAATQIRSAIVGIAQEYGDAAFNGRSLIDTFNFVAEEANHSIDAISKSVGRIEGANAILATTGDKLKFAYDEMAIVAGESFGATEKALKRVEETTADITAKLRNNIMASLQPLGEGITKEVSKIAKGLNEAFADGSINEFFEDFAKVAKVGAALLVVFNGSLIAGKLELGAYAAGIKLLTVQEAVLNRWQKLVTAGQMAHSAANVGGTATVTGLNAAMRGLWATMVANPFTAIIAVAGLATAAFLAFRKGVKDASEVQEDFNKLQNQVQEYDNNLAPLVTRYNELKEIENKTNTEQAEFIRLVQELSKMVPEATGQMDEYGNAIGLVGEKLGEFTQSQEKALKIQAEEGLKDALKSLENFEAKMEAARKGMEDTYNLKGTQGGYAYDVDVVRTGEEKLAAANRFKDAQSEVEKLRKSVEDYQKTLSDINNRAFYQEHAKLFKDISSVTEEELYNIRDSLNDIYDIAPDDFAKEKIYAQLDKVWKEINKRMAEEEAKNKPKVTVEAKFDLKEFKKGIDDTKEQYEKYYSAVKQFGKEYADKEYAQLLKQGESYAIYLNNLEQEYRKNVQARLAIGEAATSDSISLGENDKPLEKLSSKTAADYNKIFIKTENIIKDVDKTFQKTMMESLKKATEDAKKMNESLADEDSMGKAMETGWQISDALYMAADAASAMNSDAGEALKQFADASNSIMNVVQGLSTGNYLQAAGSVFQLISSAAQQEATLAAELAQEQVKSLNQMLEAQNRQLDLYLERLRGVSGDERYNQEKATLELIQKQTAELDKQIAATDVQVKGKGKLDEEKVWGAFGIGIKYDDTMAADLKSSIDLTGVEELRKFIESGALQETLSGENGEALANSYISKLKDWDEGYNYDEGERGIGGVYDVSWTVENIDELYTLLDEYDNLVEQRRQIFEELTGSTSDSIADSIAQGFTNGQRSIEDFASSFEDMMKQALINNFKNQYILKEAESFFQSFGAAAQDGYTAQELASLKTQWADSINSLSEQFKVYEDVSNAVFDENIFAGAGSGASKSGMSGSIQNIKEETANILSGQVNSIIMDMKRGIDLQIEMAASLRSIDRNTEKLDGIDRNIETMASNIDKMANSSSSERAYGNY